MQRRKVLNDDAMNAYIKLLQSREESFATMEGRKMSICLPTTFYLNIEDFGVQMPNKTSIVGGYVSSNLLQKQTNCVFQLILTMRIGGCW